MAIRSGGCNWRGMWPAATTTVVLFAATHIDGVPIALVVTIAPLGIALPALSLDASP